MKDQMRFCNNWIAEIDCGRGGDFLTNKDDDVIVQLVNEQTGEIRQKTVSIDFIARRVFQSEIETWRKEWGEIVTVKK